MSEITQNAIFAREVQRKLDELIDWILENVPDKKHTLSCSDFLAARQSICSIASGKTDLNHIEPEPADGGAQYINDNPAPWP
jgi:hypothetical protein